MQILSLELGLIKDGLSSRISIFAGQLACQPQEAHQTSSVPVGAQLPAQQAEERESVQPQQAGEQQEEVQPLQVGAQVSEPQEQLLQGQPPEPAEE